MFNKIIHTVAIVSIVATVVKGDEFPFRDGYPLEVSNISMRGPGTLTIAGHRFRAGEKLIMDIRFANRGGDDFVYNPFFAPLLPLPAAVAVYDSQKQYIGDYLNPVGGSQAGISTMSWVYLVADGYVGATLWRPAGHIPGTTSESRQHPLPPGRYYLQVVFYNAFIGRDTKSSRLIRPKDGNLLKDHFDKTELFRSNIVEIEIVQ